jgi:hypothetical protein
MSHQRPAGLSEDVLLIHYAALAPDATAHRRLRVLAAIGRLLNRGGESCFLQELCLEGDILRAIERWLEGEEGSRFWQLEEARIISLRPCEKHILVGTRQLLDDLSTVLAQPDRPGLADLDLLWQAANTFFERECVEVE